MPVRLGELEQLVLIALLRLGEDSYGVTVRDEITRRTGRAMSFGTAYSTLARLEDKGLVSTRLGVPTAERGGRGKKHFVISAAGRKAVDASLRALRTMTRGLDPRWELS